MNYIIIAGSRDFTNYEMLKSFLDKMREEVQFNFIVSGGARGADRLGERYAKENGIELIVMNAEWDKYGKSAGYRRNEDMARIATHLVAFWDGQSRGTMHMIDIAKRLLCDVRICKV